MRKMMCDVCHSENSYVASYEHCVKVKDKEITYTLDRRFCSNCHNLIYDEILDDLAIKEAYKIYNKLYGIEPNKIKELREKYHLSLELFAKIIGCAKKTLISYEQGNSIPNDTYMIMLKTIINNPESIKTIIEANKENFSIKENIIIKDKVYSHFGNNALKIIDLEDKELSINNGYTEISYEKIKNIVLYLAKEGITKTKLLKELFYLDFTFYKENACGITGLEYAKLPFGPVPDDYQFIFDSLINAKEIKIDIDLKGNYELSNVISISKPNLTDFTKEEKAMLKRITEKFKNYNTKRIVAFSHKEKGWQETENNKIISYEYAFDLQNIE